MAEDGKGGDQILQELDALSHTLYQAHTNRRHASLVLPRSAAGDANAAVADAAPAVARPRSRRLSMSPFRGRPKVEKNDEEEEDDDAGPSLVGAATTKSQSFAAVTTAPAAPAEKKGIWGWKPMRALSHIGMNRLGCLFSVEVVAAQGLPPSMNGLRLAVAVRKKETRDGAVQTMPSRVQQGAADFEETLFVRCHLYCSGGAGTGKPLRFEPRPFLLSAVAVEAPELDFGRSAVDLSLLVKESTEKSQQGERVRQWDMALPLAGKAKGGELVVKLSFQIMEDGGVGLYNQPGVSKKTTSSSSSSSSLLARKQSKLSFSITSPKVTRPEPALTPAKGSPSPDLRGIDDFKLDEPTPLPEVVVKQEQQKEPEHEPEAKADDEPEFEFDIVDKGVEGQEDDDAAKEGTKEEDGNNGDGDDKEEQGEATSVAGDEVVKEVVHDSAHTWRLKELEAITNQIKALESMMLGDAAADKSEEPQEDDEAAPALEADEEEVTREFLQLLEQGDARPQAPQVSSLKSGAKPGSEADASCFVSDLGKGLGPIVQTRDGGYLAATNPFDIPVARKELPKLAMHLSKPFVLRGQKLPGGGAELFQLLCAGGSDALCAKLGALVATEEVVGKTAEQIAFEGMASAIISARSGASANASASSSAAQSVSLLRTMAAAMSDGRKERIATGIWNAREDAVTVDEILAFSLQKIETMAIEALKVQADMADDQAPFDVSPANDNPGAGHLLDAAVPPEEWESACAGADAVTMLVVAQLRDPLRRYEAVGAPTIVIIQAGRAGGDDDEPRFKVANMHVGGLRLRSAADRRNVWDGERQRLTAMHWLVAYGLGKAAAGRKGRAAPATAKAGHDVLWSTSSRVMADMWLKPMRNPDVKIIPQK